MKNLPKHIAFIPDGNRRFAKKNNISTFEGHRLGYESFKEILTWCHEFGINEVSFWGFSTENWKRGEEETGYLMDLFLNFLTNDISKFIQDKAKLNIIGRRSDLSPKIINAIEKAEEVTKSYTEKQVNIFFNYGGQAEILDLCHNIAKQNLSPEDISIDFIRRHIWSSDISDPDLIIRTSGEQRLSGFLPWQAGYSELYFSPVLWPELSKEDLDIALDWFSKRERRFGGNSKQ